MTSTLSSVRMKFSALSPDEPHRSSIRTMTGTLFFCQLPRISSYINVPFLPFFGQAPAALPSALTRLAKQALS